MWVIRSYVFKSFLSKMLSPSLNLLSQNAETAACGSDDPTAACEEDQR